MFQNPNVAGKTKRLTQNFDRRSWCHKLCAPAPDRTPWRPAWHHDGGHLTGGGQLNGTSRGKVGWKRRSCSARSDLWKLAFTQQCSWAVWNLQLLESKAPFNLGFHSDVTISIGRLPDEKLNAQTVGDIFYHDVRMTYVLWSTCYSY